MIQHFKQLGIRKPIDRLVHLVVIHQNQLQPRRLQQIAAIAKTHVLAVLIDHQNLGAVLLVRHGAGYSAGWKAKGQMIWASPDVALGNSQLSMRMRTQLASPSDSVVFLMMRITVPLP